MRCSRLLPSAVYSGHANYINAPEIDSHVIRKLQTAEVRAVQFVACFICARMQDGFIYGRPKNLMFIAGNFDLFVRYLFGVRSRLFAVCLTM
jgi:hypothetical protein